MTGLRLEFLAVDGLGKPQDGVQIGPVEDAPFAPRVHELIWLGGADWEVVDVRWILPELPDPMCAVLSVRKRLAAERKTAR